MGGVTLEPLQRKVQARGGREAQARRRFPTDSPLGGRLPF